MPESCLVVCLVAAPVQPRTEMRKELLRLIPLPRLPPYLAQSLLLAAIPVRLTCVIQLGFNEANPLQLAEASVLGVGDAFGTTTVRSYNRPHLRS